jgi:hypothetical protein
MITNVELTAAVVLVFAVGSAPARAQACNGTPMGRSVGYEYGKRTIGTSQGLAGTLAGSHTALGGGVALRDLGEVMGQEGSLRFSFIIPASKLQICPGLGMIYQHDTWDPRSDVSVTTHSLLGRAGMGLGIEQRVYGDLSIIPYAVAHYEFALTAFALHYGGGDSSETNYTGDTTSRGQFEYGLIARYKFLYGGIAAHRSSDTQGRRPDMARWIIGVTFSGRQSAPSAPAPASRALSTAAKHDVRRR